AAALVLGVLVLLLLLRARPQHDHATVSNRATATLQSGAGPAIAPPSAPLASATPSLLALRGRVVRPDGQPVAGGTVRVLAGPPHPGAGAAAGRATTSDAAGAFVFPRLHAGTYLLEAQADTDISPTVRFGLAEGAAREALLVIFPGATLTVHVV